MGNVLSQELLLKFSLFIANQFGAYYPENRLSDLSRAIELAAIEFEYDDVEACIQWLMSSPLSQSQIETLAKFITVNETYFLREPNCFSTLRELILPKMLEEKKKIANSTIRLWSAGCSGGEEAYSLAIVLHEALGDFLHSKFEIIGTDINSIMLEKANAGVYSEWSFRNTPPAFKKTYFKKKKGKQYKILQSLKEHVSFRYLNLMDDSYPSASSGIYVIDIILCRNVLMYFSPETVSKMIEKFHRAGTPGGWLILGTSENHLVDERLYKKILVDGYVIYQKQEGEAENISNVKDTLLNSSITPTPAPTTTAPTLSADPLVVAEKLANEGKHEEALASIDIAITEKNDNPTYHYFRAIILQEIGEAQGALSALRKTIDLDSEYIMAYFLMGNIYRVLGNADESQNKFDKVLALLSALAPDERVPPTEELTAGQLAEMIRSLTSGEKANGE